MGEYFFFNGEIIRSDEKVMKLNDLALLRGFGIFDFFRTHQGVPYLMDNYIDRFFRSAVHLQLPIPFSREYIKSIIQELLSKNGIIESGIRMILTGGYTENGYAPGKPNFFILIEKINFPEKQKYDHGVTLLLYEFQRELSHIKSINYLTPISLRSKLADQNAYDVLYHYRGHVLEVSRSNFFIVKNGVIITANEGVLMGITRKSVIELAADHYPVEERPIALEELWAADETFMTGTTKKVLPVTRIDEHVFGHGEPGPVTRDLMQRFRDYENQAIRS